MDSQAWKSSDEVVDQLSYNRLIPWTTTNHFKSSAAESGIGRLATSLK